MRTPANRPTERRRAETAHGRPSRVAPRLPVTSRVWVGSTPSQLGTTLSHEEPSTKEEYVKVVMVLYPGNGHKIEFGELEGQPIPGSADGEIGLRQWLESES